MQLRMPAWQVTYMQVPVPHVSIHERNAERAAAVPQLALDSFDDAADSGSDN